jgi:small subunit ribosomal protein S15
MTRSSSKNTIVSRPVVFLPGSCCSLAFHTSALKQGRQRMHSSGSGRKSNLAIHKERKRTAEANKAHVILGTRPGEEFKWQQCDLAKVLVSEEELTKNAPAPDTDFCSDGVLHLPEHLNFGVGEQEKKLLFEHLPYLSAKGETLFKGDYKRSDWANTNAKFLEMQKKELMKANIFARIIDLQNADARGIAYENRRRIIMEFSESAQPWDPGRPEVQGTSRSHLLLT